MSAKPLSQEFKEAAGALVDEAVHTILAYRGMSEEEILRSGVKADFPVTSRFLTVLANQLAGGLLLDFKPGEAQLCVEEIKRRGSDMKELLAEALRQNEFINPQFEP